MQTYFILGTDTDCGKTYVTCELIRYWQTQAKTVVGLKPVASGCIEQNGYLVSEDATRLNQQNEVQNSVRECVELANSGKWWRLKEPISPHLAAEKEGTSISLDKLIIDCQDPAFQKLDYLLIEGAGGLLVPLNHKETWVDFLKRTKIPVILVVGMRLGCINHACLTRLALSHYQIECAGWIANCLDPAMLYLSENLATLKDKLDCPLLATVPYGAIEACYFLEYH